MSNSTANAALSFSIGSLLKLFKNAYSGHPKEIWTIVILTIINRMGTMVIPFLSVYLTTQLQFSLREAGVLASAFGFGSLGGSYFGGKLSDKIGPRYIIIASLFLSGVMFIFMQFVSGFYSLFFFILVTSLFGEAYRPASMTAISQFVPKSEIGRTMAFYRLAINLGMTAAPLFGGVIAVKYGYHILFWIDGVTCILGATYFYWVTRSWNLNIKVNQNLLSEENKSKTNLFSNKSYLWFLISTLLIGFAFVQWFHTIPVFIKTVWGFDESYIGIMMAVSSGLIVLVEMPLIHVIEKRGLMLRFMKMGVFIVGLSFLFFFMPASIAIGIIAALILTFGEILFLPFNNAIPVYMSEDHNRGIFNAWYWMTWSVVMISAPLVGFALADFLGWEIFWGIIISIVFIGLLIIQRLGNRMFG
jgi:MFS family permease